MMILDQQLHGYRHGHQLLSASVKLPKPDQDLVDRLSDVAGPLRPSERFEPYLTCYPLPSGTYYVLARTWQDFEAPRAGCVRTRSLFVPMPAWIESVDVVGLVESLTSDGSMAPARRLDVDRPSQPFPHVELAQGVELVEALFLEDRKPIVVFDASNPEGITLRLLAAFWPSFRRTFAISTFALSPRTLGGRSFDLAFAPMDARSRFSEWPGRRVDARKPVGARHRWSLEIASRVFAGDRPSLLRDDALGELSSKNGGTEAELRISLLWNDLHHKLQTSPNAALGLLDIANSRPTRNLEAIRRIEPELGRAAQRAVVTLPPPEAWRFLLALTDKLAEVRLKLSVAKAIRGAAVYLASSAPMAAIANVEMLATARGHEMLLGAVGDGIAQKFNTACATSVVGLDSATFLQLMLLSPSFAEVSLTFDSTVSARLATAIAEAPAKIRDEAKRRLLRLLVENSHADAASILIADLDREELLAETKLLHAANNFGADKLYEPLVERAQTIGAALDLRDTIAGLPISQGADALLLALLFPEREDLAWLLETPLLAEGRRLEMLGSLLRAASASQLKSMITGRQCDSLLQLLMADPASNLDIVVRILADEGVEPSSAISTTMRLLPYANGELAHSLASRALVVALRHDIGTRRNDVDSLLEVVGTRLNGPQAIRAGMGLDVPSQVVAANLSAFNRSIPPVRKRIMLAIEHLASAVIARGRIDYPEYAVADAASLLWDSALVDHGAFTRSAARLLPFLLQARHEPASPLIAAAFPSVYQELQKAEDFPDILKFFFFVDWDRCKTARHELVDRFMCSSWRATDIALAAARAGDPSRILRRIAKQDDGSQVIASIESNLSAIPDPWRGQVSEALKEVPHGGSLPE